ncbi:MAG: sirohydrochlorin chelatase [Propioniciclava sp.]
MTRTDPAPPAAAVPTTPPPLVIAGHGTRVNDGAAAAATLVEAVRGLLPGVRVEAGFVELTPPTIDAALDTVLADASAAVVVPLMIGTGGHVREDIPEAIDASRARHRDATVVYTRHLGSPKPMVDAVHARIAAARGEWPAEETDVVMVGRGCSVTEANADHVRLSRVVFETGGYRQVLSAFIQVARPTLPQILRQYNASGSRRIVVMPHFLFTGRLDQWVHQQVEAFTADHPEAEIRVANVIGPCDELAQVVAQRHMEGALRARTTAGSPVTVAAITSHDPLRDRFLKVVNEESL